MSSLSLNIKAIKLGSRFVAATTVGGFTIRGNAAETLHALGWVVIPEDIREAMT